MFFKQKPPAQEGRRRSECSQDRKCSRFIDFLSTFSEVARLCILSVCGGSAAGSERCDSQCYECFINVL